MAYLGHFGWEDTLVEVMEFARTTESLTGGFVSIQTAWEVLSEPLGPGRNGSEIGRSLEQAGRALARGSVDAARRVLLLTDLATRTDLDPSQVAPSIPRGAVVHMATIDEGGPWLRRDDDHEWAAVPRATGGVLWKATASTEDGYAKQSGVFEEWARPVRLDHVKVWGPGLEYSTKVTTLPEGEGLAARGIAMQNVTSVTFEAELWSRRIVLERKPNDAFGKRRAALFFGTASVKALEATDMRTLATLGRVVSPVTSYVIAEPGVRPELGKTGGIGEGGCGCFADLRIGNVGTLPHGPVDYRALLAGLLSPAVAACKVEGALAITVETTSDEVVDVAASLSQGATSADRRCVEEATWGIRLSEEFRAARRMRLTLEL